MAKNIYPRNGILWARFQVNGVKYRESLRTRSEGLAAKRLKARIEEVQNEACFGIEGPRSWPSCVIEWSANATAELGAQTLKRYLTSLTQLRPHLDDKMIHQVDVSLVRQIVKARKRVGVTIATIRRDLTAMSSVIEYAIDEEWIDTNPTLAVRSRKRLREKRDPIVLPQRSSIEQTLEASPARFRDAQELARVAGMRQAEIFGLKRDQLGDEITIVGKGNKLRVIPYTAEMREIVDRQPPFLRSPYVFWHSDGQRWKSPSSRFADIQRRLAQKAARERGEFTPYRFHDLRHLFAVEYLRSGKGSIYDLRDLMGHESVKTTEEYLAFLTPEQKKLAMHGVAQKPAQGKRSARNKDGNNG